MDATVPLDIDITFQSATASSGDVEWDVLATLVPTAGGTLGSLTEASASVVKTVTAANTVFMANVDLSVDGLFPGALLVIKVTRDAQAGNTEDTYADGVNLMFVECRGTKWKV